MNSPFNNIAISIVTATSLLASFGISTVSAQANTPQNRYGQEAEYVWVYEDCYFRGKSRALTAGDYQNVRDLNIQNDAISSAKVPAGMQLVLFEDEQFRGKSTVIDADVSCLDKNWNDKASSLQVSSGSRYGNNRNSNARYGNSRNNDGRYGNRRNPSDDNYANNSGKDYTQGITYVAFVGSALEQANGNQWRIANTNGSVDTFRETKRDKQNIYLTNNRINQQVEIDLVSNQVRFIAPNGNKVNYAITGADKRERNKASTVGAPSGVIKGSCFDYKAYTLGGLAGIRFSHDHEAFFQYDTSPRRGRICHQGSLTMEINKKDLATDVIVEINGDKYRFAKGEKEDVLLNTWYRKMIKLRVQP